MKIKFTSPKEKTPTQEQGLDVLYAPGKRLAFKMRWYLILLLVLSPFLWLLGSWLWQQLVISAPAQLLLPSMELRASDNAQIVGVDVNVGDHVREGEPLIRLDNSDWRMRLNVLEAKPVAMPESREQSALTRMVYRAQERIHQLKDLQRMGAATRAEVQSAQDELDRRQLELEQFQRAQTLASVDRTEPQRLAEKQWLESRLNGLDLIAPKNGLVTDILVAAGENVGPGTPLLNLRIDGEPVVFLFLDPEHGAFAAPGQRFLVKLPDGKKLEAEVMRAVDDAVPVPQELRAAFSAPTRNLKVAARLLEPLPEHWAVQHLSLSAQFPYVWRW